jgi:hypothetical protein
MQTSLESSQTVVPPILTNGQNLALGSALLQAHTFSAMMQYQIEALSFLKHRYEEDVKLINDLVASGELNDAFDVITVFLQNAATEYATETSKMISLGSKLAAETAKRVRRHAVETAKDISVATTA